MKDHDEACDISNPRLLSAVYFSLLAIIATIAIDSILYLFGIGQLIAIFEGILLAAIIAACFGAIFGKLIIQCEKPYRGKAFLWGFLMVLIAMPIYDVFFLYLLEYHHTNAFAGANFKHLLYVYLFILFYSFILVGLWLAIAAGFAAMYLRGHLVYDIMHSLNQERKIPKKKRKIKENKLHIPH